MKIDFVSDIACPWCAVGLNALEQALARIGDAIPINLEMQPYELNPGMAKDGVDAGEYLMNKYGMSAAQLQASRANLRARGADVGFTFGERSRIWNTFDAHRLLYWAGGLEKQGGKQRALKHALLGAYHTDGRNPGDTGVLLEMVKKVGLDVDAARTVIESGQFADDVRQAEAHWQQSGINAVPSVIINGRHLIQGGQPAEVFEQAIRQTAAETETAANPA